MWFKDLILLYNNQLQRTCRIYNIWRTHSVYLVEINKEISFMFDIESSRT